MTLDHQGAVDNGRSWPQRAAILTFAILQVAIPSLPALGIGEPIGDRPTTSEPSSHRQVGLSRSGARSLLDACLRCLPDPAGTKAQRPSVRIGWPSAGAFFGNALWALYTQTFGLSVFSAFIIIWTLICLLMLYRNFIETRPTADEGRALPRCAAAERSCVMAYRCHDREHCRRTEVPWCGAKFARADNCRRRSGHRRRHRSRCRLGRPRQSVVCDCISLGLGRYLQRCRAGRGASSHCRARGGGSRIGQLHNPTDTDRRPATLAGSSRVNFSFVIPESFDQWLKHTLC